MGDLFKQERNNVIEFNVGDLICTKYSDQEFPWLMLIIEIQDHFVISVEMNTGLQVKRKAVDTREGLDNMIKNRSSLLIPGKKKSNV